jgi:hypothetical protein
MLGNALNECEISLEVMSGLRKLVNLSLEDPAKKNILSNFSKNYIPLLCSLYTDMSKSEGIRLASLETTKLFLKVCTIPIAVKTF